MSEFDAIAPPLIGAAIMAFGSGFVLGFIFGMVRIVFFSGNGD